MSPYSDPERRAALAAALKRLRLGAGVQQDALAAALGVGQPSISRIENGQQSVSVPQVRQWCATTGADQQRTAELVALAEDVLMGAASWEAMQGQPDAPSQIGSHNVQATTKQAEANARTISNYQPLVVPGLLQTSAYALRVVTSDGPIGDAAQRVLMRMERQEAALADATKTLRFLIPETVLRWPFGTIAEQVEQARRISDAIRDHPHLDIAILPMRSNPVWRLHGFSIYDDVTDGEPYVHLELLTRPLDETEPSRVDRYRRAYGRMRAEAIDGDDARSLLAEIAEGLRDR